MKKKLIFVNESLALAGGEKSLVALLSKIDYSKFEVDLQLFNFSGELVQFLPKEVNVLAPLAYTSFSEKSYKEIFKSLTITNFFTMFFFLISRLNYSLQLRKEKLNNPEKAVLYWKSIKKCLESNPKEYDVAIAYAQGIPTFFIADKIKANKKLAWVNVNVKFKEDVRNYNKKYYHIYNRIVAVSQSTKEHLAVIYPQFEANTVVIKDMIDYHFILEMAKIKTFDFDSSVFKILTIARLNKDQKGYDITLETCNVLKEKGFKFHWYMIGEGGYRSDMENYIKDHQLGEYVTLLGTTLNPYSAISSVDLYVQTSRHEGFGLSIAEARLLNIPVITTRFDSVFMQMKNEVNGLVVDINAGAVADAILRIYNDKNLYNSIVENLKKEEKENYTSLNIFYGLLN